MFDICGQFFQNLDINCFLTKNFHRSQWLWPLTPKSNLFILESKLMALENLNTFLKGVPWNIGQSVQANNPNTSGPESWHYVVFLTCSSVLSLRSWFLSELQSWDMCSSVSSSSIAMQSCCLASEGTGREGILEALRPSGWRTWVLRPQTEKQNDVYSDFTFYICTSDFYLITFL